MKFLYHANCNDGSGAALAAWMRHGDEGHDYVAAQYGDEPPDVVGEDVYILDFSYPRDVLLDIAQTANFVTVIDHHKTAQADLAEALPDNVGTVFDMNHSGAVLSWMYFHPDRQIPFFFKLIQDRDLWTHAFDDSDSVFYALQCMPDFREWRQYVDGDGLLNRLVDQGEAIQSFLKVKTQELADTAKWINMGEYRVLSVHCPKFMASDVLANLLKTSESQFVVGIYHRKDGKKEFSLRSRKGGTDVSEIAKQYGGGGHKHAAGFVTS